MEIGLYVSLTWCLFGLYTVGPTVLGASLTRMSVLGVSRHRHASHSWATSYVITMEAVLTGWTA